MDQPKTHLTATYLSQNTLGKIKIGTYIAAHLRNRVIKLINNSSMNIIEYNSRSFLTMSSNQSMKIKCAQNSYSAKFHHGIFQYIDNNVRMVLKWFLELKRGVE